MTTRSALRIVILLLGGLALQAGLLDLPRADEAFAEQSLTEVELRDMEVIHKQNIGQLHGLHHEMRAAVKQLTRNSKDQEAVDRLVAQLRAVSQALDTVATTEKDHPQWASSWSQRHARLVVLTHEMESLLTGTDRRDDKRPISQIGNKLQEMKDILDVW